MKLCVPDTPRIYLYFSWRIIILDIQIYTEWKLKTRCKPEKYKQAYKKNSHNEKEYRRQHKKVYVLSTHHQYQSAE